jgi:hypothetical protein
VRLLTSGEDQWEASVFEKGQSLAGRWLAGPGARPLKGLVDAWPWRARQDKTWQWRRHVRHGHPGRGGHGQERWA